ncbi:hypothetical protein [Indiicoccus explosivorum]|uniref:hypothetical protein n=1 Tax=Indiicoccus explosivorum TaxID=1917864 RepID=UPI000B437058|nr:hypothetical protein [Indiicoccus explosivorum]
MSGAFLTSRDIFKNGIWTDVPKFRIFFFIVGNAVFSETGVEKGGVHVGRGQYLRSLRNLREDLVYYENNAEKMYGMATLNRKIAELVEEGRLQTEKTKLGTLFTVVNYAIYQDFSAYKSSSLEQRRNGVGTASEQQRNNKNLENYVNQENKSTTAADAHAQGQGSSGPTDYQQRLLQRYVQLRGYGFDSTPKDYMTAIEIEQANIPLDVAIKAMERKFAEFQPKHSKDKIHSLSYCAGAIFDANHRPAAMPQKTEEQKQQDQEYNYGF